MNHQPIKFAGLLLFISIISAFCIANFVGADSSKNTSGYAWSENIGWVSFNNSSDGSSINYGVNIDSVTGNLSGHAWSENIGWVSFNRADAGNPPTAPFNGGSGPIAQYNKSTGEVIGWMRVLANGGGWDGWIKSYNITLDINGDWHGYAWSDLVVGWLSFNSAEGGGSSYKITSAGVVNQPPTVSGLTVSGQNYCSTPYHYFSWTYSDVDGDPQTKFDFQVDNDSNFSSPEINRTINTSAVNQSVIVSVPNIANQLNYNTTYYWRVKVYDGETDSGWIEGSSFTTEKHQYPDVNFNWSPTQPDIDQETIFTDLAAVYGSTKSVWAWTFQDGNPATSGAQNPIVQFSSVGGKQITLEVTDSDGYTCSNNSMILQIQAELPNWQEK
ncbi:MAG: hypothetical protein ABII95_02030 [Patescibacteria group bacterium]